MKLIDAVETAFSLEGSLARAYPGFSVRQSQLDMARAVAQTIEERSVLVAEAGTGTGKTFAYLVPALLSSGRVLLSTASKTLQDQLFERDLPLVRHALARPVTVALLKGRANYVCLHFLQRTEQEARLPSIEDTKYLKSIQWFAKVSKTGDKADCPDVPEQASVWNYVTSTRENCLGQACGFYEDCFLVKARRQAQAAEVVVVNHHLFLADLAMREEAQTELLPTADVVIFDEAHQLRDIATHFFGFNVSTHQWSDLLRDIVIEGRISARDAGDWDRFVRPLENCLKELRAELAMLREIIRIPLSQLKEYKTIETAIFQVDVLAQDLSEMLTQMAQRSEAWQKILQRFLELNTLWRQCLGQETIDQEAGMVRWLTLSHGMAQLSCSPMDVADAFQRCREGDPKAWIFTSATLSVQGNMSHFTHALGLEQAQCHVWPSPFDYSKQALFCIPEDGPSPKQPNFNLALCELLWPLLQASEGGVFYLCTTLRATQQVGDWLKSKNSELNLSWTILVQGTRSKGELLEQFRSEAKPILVGSASFWEGVDVKGQGLRLVVIDKIPFAPPDDPLVAARSDWMRSQGMNPFRDMAIPEAAIALKQGAGRLIRDQSDRGVLVIGDSRILSEHYGKLLWRSLPPFARTRRVEQAVDYMKQLVMEFQRTGVTH